MKIKDSITHLCTHNHYKLFTIISSFLSQEVTKILYLMFTSPTYFFISLLHVYACMFFHYIFKNIALKKKFKLKFA